MSCDGFHAALQFHVELAVIYTKISIQIAFILRNSQFSQKSVLNLRNIIIKNVSQGWKTPSHKNSFKTQ